MAGKSQNFVWEEVHMMFVKVKVTGLEWPRGFEM
jgi:hypothetical protein